MGIISKLFGREKLAPARPPAPAGIGYRGLPLQILHKNSDGVPTTVFVTRRLRAESLVAAGDQQLLRWLVTSSHIYSWLDVEVGGVVFRDVFAVMVGGFRSPGLEAKPPLPIHTGPTSDRVRTPTGAFFQKIHIVRDAELDAAPDKYVRSGLWFSASLAHADTLVGYNSRLYIVGSGKTRKLLTAIATKGARAFDDYESFPDPTISIVDEDVIIDPRELAKKPWMKANP